MARSVTQTEMFASAYETALVAALGDLRAENARSENLKSQVAVSEARTAELAQLVQSLLTMIPEERRAPYSRQLQTLGIIQNLQSARNGPALGNVVELFRREDGKKLWTASEVQDALAEKKAPVDVKSIYNALGYLERTGRLKRVSRGQYVVVDLGVGVEVGPDLFDDRHSTPKETED